MFGRRTSRQGSESDGLGDGVDWTAVQDLVTLVQNKQILSKDTLAGIKKSLKSPSKSHVCKTLTTLDSIAANCTPSIRLQLADAKWIEMLISVCYKNPTAALPICQLFSNWVCSYSHEQLGHSANFASQALKQKGYAIPPPAPLAYHMAEVAQQGTPMIGFQRGFDFTTVDLMPAAESSETGSLGSRHGSGASRPAGQPAQQLSQTQVGGNMSQKLQGMHHGVHELREMTQMCQSIIDAGPAGADSDASQQCQRGWHLAKKCSGWANEVQVMVACEPSDSVLAALLQMNDDLLAAVSRWESTASCLVMQQSQSAAPLPTVSAQGSASSSRAAITTPELSDSSTSSTSDLPPIPVASGGLFWSNSGTSTSGNIPNAATQQQQLPQQQQQKQLYPLVYSSSVRAPPGMGSAARQDQGLGQLASHGNYLDELAGVQPHYPHQTPVPTEQSHGSDITWQAFGAGGGMPSALPSETAVATGVKQAEASGRADAPHEFHGTVLSYRLAEPQRADEPMQEPELPLLTQGNSELQRPAEGAASWLNGQEEATAGAQLAGQQPFDPFAVAPQQQSHNLRPRSISASEPAAASTPQYSGSSSQAGQLGTDRLDPPPHSAYNPTPAQPPAGLWSDEDALSSRAASSDTVGSRALSIPLPQSASSRSMAPLPVTQIMSSQILASKASGSTAAQRGRSPSPVLDLGQEALPQASNQGLSSASAGGLIGVRSGAEHGVEVEQLRQQLQDLEAQHEAEVKRMQEDHAARVAAIQAQAVSKMKELIEKVKEQTMREREQVELRLQEAHQAEQNALAHLQASRNDCREKDGMIADLQRKLEQTPFASSSSQQRHDLESDLDGSGQRRASSEGPDAAALEQVPFGGIPRPRSASMTERLPSVAPSAKRSRMLRAGSQLDKGSASINGLQAYYRQPALRVRFTPGQLEELSQGTAGPSHKEWAAKLKLPHMDRRTSS